MKDILQRDEKVLREIAAEIPIKDIGSLKIKKILKEMDIALTKQDDGVAIAAPQIGYSFRIFTVAGKVFDKNFMDDKAINSKESNTETVEKEEKSIPKNLVFINPKITKLSRTKKWVPEGCLSVRWLYGKTYRSTKATIEAYDENGAKFVRGASGLLAQIFQHETDHLNGILFHDHAKDLKEEEPQ
ncbi:MAG: peptide deformylase [Candidatus Nomurabacteria bacterium]|nr:peptide deformylase [Candidatus Nomurabacteria bacterium]